MPTKSQLAAVETRFGLDDPCYDQTGNPCLGPFVERLGQYAQGDFGTNLRGREVTDIVATAAPSWNDSIAAAPATTVSST